MRKLYRTEIKFGQCLRKWPSCLNLALNIHFMCDNKQKDNVYEY